MNNGLYKHLKDGSEFTGADVAFYKKNAEDLILTLARKKALYAKVKLSNIFSKNKDYNDMHISKISKVADELSELRRVWHRCWTKKFVGEIDGALSA